MKGDKDSHDETKQSSNSVTEPESIKKSIDGSDETKTATESDQDESKVNEQVSMHEVKSESKGDANAVDESADSSIVLEAKKDLT